MGDERRDRFTGLYEATADRVMSFCLRHLPPSAAEDVVSDTFLTAWRRLDVVPDEPLPWLLVTARNLIRNQYRSQARAFELTDRLSQVTKLAAEPADVTAERRGEILTALGGLSDDDREALLLTAWDGLSGAEAAEVLGITHGALRVRVHRARRKVAGQALDPTPLRSTHA